MMSVEKRPHRLRGHESALRLVLATAIVWLLPGLAAAQDRYALLVGVGAFADKTIHTLDGPPFDVDAMRRELIDRWRFPTDHVQTLVNEQATRVNVLAGLDSLIERSHPGDFVVFFFSGHGTSRQDQNMMLYDLHPATGALFPYDAVKGGSVQKILDSLIVGRRDLRPRFMRLDQARQVLLIMDACYSKNVTRSFGKSSGVPKSEPLLGGQLQGFASTVAREPYPYRNTVSILAASEAEQARDISFADIREGKADTIDHKPKGALTDALLRGFRGEANTDDNGTLTLGELFDYVREEVKGRFSHSPQLVLPDGKEDALKNAALFGSRTAPPRVAQPRAAGPLRVKVDAISPALQRRLASIDGVALSVNAFDVHLIGRGSRVELYHESGDLLEAFSAGAESAIVDRVKRQVRANELVDFTFPNQRFNVRVDIPTRTGVLKAGTEHTLTFDADDEAQFLVLDIDREGQVTVLSPWTQEDLRPATSRRVEGVRVTPPEGTEFVKVFAFKKAPAWVASWVQRPVLPADSPEIVELLTRLRGVRDGASEARLKIVTVP